MLSRLLIIPLKVVLFIVGNLPFPILKVLSRLLFFFLYYFPGYRKNVVLFNMMYALPDFSGTTLHTIRKAYFLHLSELIIEVIKGLYMSRQEMDERVFLTPASREMLNKYAAAGKNIVMLMGHYGNWEWASMMALNYCKLPYFSFYAPLSNAALNEFIIDKRSRWGAQFFTPKAYAESVEQMQRNTCQVGLVADQSPTGRKNTYTTRFLSLETPFLNGADRISRTLDAAVIYVRLQKTGFGSYTIDMQLLTDDVNAVPTDQIVEMYARHLERDIYLHPEWWIWSHKRWKGQIPY